MARKNLIKSDFLPYHVTARANNREIFHLDLPQVWEVLTEELLLASIIWKVEVHAFVLMPNHFHLLVTTPQEELGKVVGSWLSYVTRAMNLKSGRTGRVFGGRYHWTIVNSGLYYAKVYKYIYRNPVRAGLVDKVEAHEFSTIAGLCGSGRASLPLYYPRCGHGMSFVPNDIGALLDWLNRPFPQEAEASIAQGIRKSVFEIPKDRMTRRSPDWFDAYALPKVADHLR